VQELIFGVKVRMLVISSACLVISKILSLAQKKSYCNPIKEPSKQ